MIPDEEASYELDPLFGISPHELALCDLWSFSTSTFFSPLLPQTFFWSLLNSFKSPEEVAASLHARTLALSNLHSALVLFQLLSTHHQKRILVYSAQPLLCVALPQLLQQFEGVAELHASTDYNSWSRPGLDHLQILKALKKHIAPGEVIRLAELVAKCRLSERKTGETKIWRDYNSKALEEELRVVTD